MSGVVGPASAALASIQALPKALDPLAMPNGGASLFVRANLDTVEAGARLAKPLTSNVLLYGEADAGYTRLGGQGWNPFAQATAGVAVRF